MTMVKKTEVSLPIDTQIRSRCQTGKFDVNLRGKENYGNKIPSMTTFFPYGTAKATRTNNRLGF